MKKQTIKTQWASLVHSGNGGIVVGLESSGKPRNLYFADHAQLDQAIRSGQLKVRQWIVAVPREICILKPLTLPTQTIGEAIRMTEFELSNLTPIPPDEVIYSCYLLSQQDHLLEVMVCLLRKNRLQNYLEPLQALNIEPTRIVISSLVSGPEEQTVAPLDEQTNNPPSRDELLQAQGLVSIAIHKKWPEFNLFNRETIKKQQQKHQRQQLILTGSLSLAILFLLWLGMWGLNWRQLQRCDQIKKQITPLKQSAGQVGRKQQQIESILGQFEHRQQIKELFNDLILHTPKHISFSSLNYQTRDGQATLRFKGQADNMANAFGYTEAMREAKCLNDVQIENVQQVARSGGSIVEFTGMGKIEKQ